MATKVTRCLLCKQRQRDRPVDTEKERHEPADTIVLDMASETKAKPVKQPKAAVKAKKATKISIKSIKKGFINMFRILKIVTIILVASLVICKWPGIVTNTGKGIIMAANGISAAAIGAVGFGTYALAQSAKDEPSTPVKSNSL